MTEARQDLLHQSTELRERLSHPKLQDDIRRIVLQSGSVEDLPPAVQHVCDDIFVLLGLAEREDGQVVWKTPGRKAVKPSPREEESEDEDESEDDSSSEEANSSSEADSDDSDDS